MNLIVVVSLNMLLAKPFLCKLILLISRGSVLFTFELPQEVALVILYIFLKQVLVFITYQIHMCVILDHQNLRSGVHTFRRITFLIALIFSFQV